MCQLYTIYSSVFTRLNVGLIFFFLLKCLFELWDFPQGGVSPGLRNKTFSSLAWIGSELKSFLTKVTAKFQRQLGDFSHRVSHSFFGHLDVNVGSRMMWGVYFYFLCLILTKYSWSGISKVKYILVIFSYSVSKLVVFFIYQL